MVTPADWSQLEVRRAVVDSFSGPSPTCDERNVEGDEWGVLKTTCATREYGWDWTKHKVLPRSFWGVSRCLVRVGDTIITKAGPRHRVGVTAFVDKAPPRILVSGKMVGLRPNPEVVHPPFLALALNDSRTQEFLDQRTTGMAESQVNFENGALLSAPIWLPPLKEQEAIAEALSDADSAIEALDALIAKKRDVKQAAMQQLLTGRTRLAGHREPWAQERLGNLLRYEQPTKYLVSSSDYSVAGGVPVLTAGKSFLLGYTTEDFGIYERGPTILFDDFTTATQWVDFPFKVKSSACKMLTLRSDDASLRYVFEQMQMIKYEPADHKRHWISMFATMTIPTPSLEEQRAVETVLSDMDREIEALVAQREKMRLVKQGMMQELLSGRVRLV